MILLLPDITLCPLFSCLASNLLMGRLFSANFARPPLLISRARGILYPGLPLDRLALEYFNLICDRYLLRFNRLLHRIGIKSDIFLMCGVRCIIMGGRSWGLCRGSRPIYYGWSANRGLAWVEMSESHGSLRLWELVEARKQIWNNAAATWMEVRLSVWMLVIERPAKVVTMILGRKGLISLYLYILCGALRANLGRLVHFIIENSTQFCCLSWWLSCRYYWDCRSWSFNKIILELSTRFLLKKNKLSELQKDLVKLHEVESFEF